MATISSAIEVQDRFSSVLNNLYAGLDRAVNKFETLQNVMSRSADFDVGSNLKNDLNSANQAVSNINNNINNTQNNLMQVNTTVNRISTNIINITNNQKKFNDEVKEGVNSTDSLIGKVKSLVGAYLGFQGVKALINTSDQFIQTTARLNMMNDGLQTTAELQDMIFQSAQRSRASYADTANAVAQLGNRARNAFNSNEEVVAFSEQLNKMFTIAGASQQEMSSATLQLTQALGSGVLRGEEFNAVFEAAPNVMQAVADYIGKPIGELKDLASEGEITADIVKKAMFAAADETNAKFESMPMTWAQVWTTISNAVLMASQPILTAINWIANNLDIIGPIVLAIAAAIGVYAIGTYGAAAATAVWSTVQKVINAELWACPVTWIVLAIIALITVIYLAVAAINRWKGTNISATGIVAAIFWSLGAVIWNVIAYTWNKFAAFYEFFINISTDKTYAVKRLFVNLATNVIDACIAMTKGVDGFATNLANGVIDGVNLAIRAWNAFMNILPDSVKSFLHIGVGTEKSHTASITGTLQNAKASLQNLLGDKPEDYIEIPKMQMKDIGASAMAGYNWGANSKLSNLFNSGVDNTDYQSLLDAAEGASQGAGDTAKNTGAMKDALDITEEDLKYMRDIAEQEVINRFTTAEIKVDMTNYNSVNSDLDIDGIVDTLAIKVEEQMNISAEGVHE
ncbi:putative phage tail tape measure protein [Clostridium neonatale]|uniref:tape measure protein n=1 Tax=Clostridium neonatale TaxID=137838 RepID=UPI00291B7676|nr:putative phage tail tape measure protein [Clostridium neonatale]CAI3548926.1 putative phage tail tape measure protein [Clostridium neonatale]CAI3550484.1 putative phage tail tape measure protein [Clostridium neonatale]CAI3551386.1 putative phage tail tape measure protein [Clostridium neonatale]CAI3729802.1 putative phage tail tape measure protein [Clostridium neonatale]